MARVIGGNVSFEDGVKHSPNAAGDYALTRKARCELTYEIEEGDDHSSFITNIADLARGKVNYMLMTKLPEGGAATADPQPKPVKPASSAAKPKTSSASAKPASTATAAATPGPSSTSEQPSAGSDTASDPLAMEEPADKVTTETVGDFDFNEPIESAAITDAELNAAVQKRNAALKDADKIRKLIGSFNPDPSKPFTLAGIPTSLRNSFITKLEALV